MNQKEIFNSKSIRKGYGILSDLKNEIGENAVEHLGLLGYIHIGISPKYGETWSLTKRGKETRYFWDERISLRSIYDNICSIIYWLIGIRFPKL